MAWVSWICLFLALYLFDVGHGFISDDFAWIVHGRLDDFNALRRIFTTSQGFYRPLVSLSFGMNEMVFGLSAKAYGVTNLGLALVDAWLLSVLARRLGLGSPAARGAAILWLFNVHGMNMSILWISGRTSLLLVLFSVLAALAFLAKRCVLTGGVVLAAMFCKEEAVLLPLLFVSWVLLGLHGRGERPNGHVFWSVAPQLCALLIYLGLRASSGAIFLTSAPDFYTPTFRVASIARNFVEYADRASTFTLAAIIGSCLLAGRRPQLTPESWRVVRLCLAWAIAGFGITMFMPVRSSLYVVFPSVGVAIAGACVIDSVCAAMSPQRKRNAICAAFAALVVLGPIYRARNERWVELADLSASVIRQLRDYELDGRIGAAITILDDTATRTRLQNAWAGLVPEVATVMFEDRFRLAVASPEVLHVENPKSTAVLLLKNGTLMPTP